MGVGLGIGLESMDRLGGWGEADEVEMDPSDPVPTRCLGVGFQPGTFQSLEDEGVDRVADPTGILWVRDAGGTWRSERPMVLLGCPGEAGQGQDPDREAGRHPASKGGFECGVHDRTRGRNRHWVFREPLGSMGF
jgi:hypothetical protein